MNRSSELRIEPVRTARQRADFYRVKKNIYRSDPAAVIPMQSIEWSQLDPHVHPFYLHAEREVFVAYKNDRPVARIAAIIDRLHNQYYQDRVGFFGFFECPNDPVLANSLLCTAESWLGERGCDAVRGPMNPSMKGEFGVLVDGHEHSPRLMMAHTPRYYADLIEKAGYLVVKRFYAFNYPWKSDPEWQRRSSLAREYDRRFRERFPKLRLEHATRHNVEARLREINTIGNRIRSVGWGFVPLTNEELDYMVSQLKRVINPAMVISAYYGDELVGYCVTVPDVNWAIKRAKGPWDWIRFLQLPLLLRKIPQCRLIALGVDPNWRKKGIAGILVKTPWDFTHLYDTYEFGWVAEDNLPSISLIARALPLDRYRTYHVYQKAI